MSKCLRCKFCGGYIKYIKHKESFLDQDGRAMGSDIDEVQYFKCSSCGAKKYILEDISDIVEEE